VNLKLRISGAFLSSDGYLFRKFFAWSLLALAIMLEFSDRLTQNSDGWQVGEWLINYHDGFVRRGLFGSLLLDMFDLSAEATTWLLFSIQITLYLSFIIFLTWSMHRRFYSFASIALCCSPAVGLFMATNFGLTRKELIGIFALVILSILQNSKLFVYRIGVSTSMILFALACLSSEINAFLFPAFLYTLDCHFKNRAEDFYRSKFLKFVKPLLLLTTLGTLCLSTLYHGDKKTSSIICQQVISQGFKPDMCGGAINAIGWSLLKTVNQVRQSFPGYFGYLPLIFLASLPILLSGWQKKNRKWLILSTITVLPLFLIVVDYGRWIFLWSTQLTVMILNSNHELDIRKLWNKISVPFFVLSWGLPAWAYFGQVPHWDYKFVTLFTDTVNHLGYFNHFISRFIR